jgi:hypothetical protein
MVYQKAVEFSQYFRCYVVGRKKVRIMGYDPRRPHDERYLENPPQAGKMLLKRIRQDALKLCNALGYEFNTVEFAVENGIPHAIDFMNPVPDADPRSVGQANFDWFVKEAADLAITKAKAAPQKPELRSMALLSATPASVRIARKRPVAKKKTSVAVNGAMKVEREDAQMADSAVESSNSLGA